MYKESEIWRTKAARKDSGSEGGGSGEGGVVGPRMNVKIQNISHNEDWKHFSNVAIPS